MKITTTTGCPAFVTCHAFVIKYSAVDTMSYLKDKWGFKRLMHGKWSTCSAESSNSEYLMVYYCFEDINDAITFNLCSATSARVNILPDYIFTVYDPCAE